jgi:hypothetical protein
MDQSLRIGVLADWARSARGNEWPDLCRSLQNFIPLDVCIYPLADLIAAPPAPDNPKGLHSIRRQDVLIINWDAVNGDPDFGAHIALRWLEHRRPELLLWVRDGNILIIESQAVLGVPCQSAYDAAVGNGELPVSGLDDPRNPLSFKTRVGNKCRKTRQFPTLGGFEDVGDPVQVLDSVNHDRMFPGTSTNLLTEQLRDLDWNKIIYRGWYRRVLPGSRKLSWVTLLKTDDRGFLRNHSTLQVAKLGTGAIFTSTMMLATTRQTRLVLAMLKCAKGNTTYLPESGSIVERLRRFWKMAVTLIAGAIAGNLAANTGAINETLHTFSSGLDISDPEKIKNVTKGVVILLGMGIFELSRRGFVTTKKWILDYIGY